MSYQIKKKFLAQEVIDYIDAAGSTANSGANAYTDAQVAAEAAARAAADAANLATAQTYADTKIADLIDSAPAVLDTLKEIADALGNDPNLSGTLTSQISAISSGLTNEITDRQSAVAAEAVLRANGDAAEALARQNADALLDGKIDQETLDRQNAISLEESTRAAADTALDNRVTTLEGEAPTFLKLNGSRAMQANLNMGGGAATQAFGDFVVVGVVSAGQTLTVKIGGQTEVFTAVSGAPANANQISLSGDPLVNTASAINSKFSAANGQAQKYSPTVVRVTLGSNYVGTAGNGILQLVSGSPGISVANVDGSGFAQNGINAISYKIVNLANGTSAADAVNKSQLDTVQASVTAEATARAAADSVLDGQITQEISDRQAAVSSEASTRAAADTALSGRITSLEADHYLFDKEKKVLSSGDITAQHIDLARLYEAKSLVIFVDRLAIHQGDDYTVSVAAGKTRITFINSMVNPGNEKLDAGDTVTITGAYRV